MEVIELRRLVLRVDRRDERIARGLDGTVRDAEQQRAGEQAPEVPREDREEDAGGVADERHPEDPPEAEGVDERAAEHHRECKAPERRAINPAHLLVSQVELRDPVARRPAAQGETHGSGDQGDATRREEAGGIHTRRRGWVYGAGFRKGRQRAKAGRLSAFSRGSASKIKTPHFAK
jgi:hypothetical protein